MGPADRSHERRGRNFYVPAGRSGTIAIVGVRRGGVLSVLGTVPVADGSRRVASSQHGQAQGCDPKAERLLVVRNACGLTR